jgi:hypothetical protein
VLCIHQALAHGYRAMQSSLMHVDMRCHQGCSTCIVQDAWCVRQCCVLLHALAPTLVASPMAAAAWGDVVPAGSRKQGAAGSCTVVEMCCNMLTRVLATEKLPDEEWWVMQARILGAQERRARTTIYSSDRQLHLAAAGTLQLMQLCTLSTLGCTQHPIHC